MNIAKKAKSPSFVSYFPVKHGARVGPTNRQICTLFHLSYGIPGISNRNILVELEEVAEKQKLSNVIKTRVSGLKVQF